MPQAFGAFLCLNNYLPSLKINNMKRICIPLFAFFALISGASAQDKPSSPSATATGKIGASNIKIVYCQPSARGRKIMDELVPFGEVWRTGANAATTIQIDAPIKIEGKDLAVGKYSLFTIPNKTEWTLIINKESNQWGAFNYNDKFDLFRVSAKPLKSPAFVETFNISIGKDEIVLTWENTRVAFKVKG